MSAVGQARATLDDLYRIPGKAELVGGRIVHFMATGHTPNRVAGRIFAAEVRSENDYGNAAEAEMAEKRADYFAAGTQVVWDVDPKAECIHVYRASDPGKSTTLRSGQSANAEPAVPGWGVPVDWIFG